ncbi:DUF4105 domain-containing protein [Rhizobium sp. OAE497]|uniref:Lnb N-terminal periplasmic domain-containing protein n=1 Tax=Rhizobium sp. OAE497 TaxID=2663796 RepID=UPI00102A865C
MSWHRAIRLASWIMLAFLLTVAATWATLALWYRLPASEFMRALVAGLFALLSASAMAGLFTRWRLRAAAAYVLTFAVVVAWWNSIEPPRDGTWAADVARQATGTIDGDVLTLFNVRDFEWRSSTEAVNQRWMTRTYDLSKLRTLDLIMSYWSGPEIAHVIFSFGFDDGEQLAWSIEVRRSEGGAFSPLADLFKSNPMVLIAAEERDVVGVRSNFRGEDVQLYRLRASPKQMRSLLREYVTDANALAETPQFYNSLTSNCTTTVLKMMRVVGASVPLDWRLIINGYLPEYAYERGALNNSVPLDELRASSHIGERARRDGLSPKFSKEIRVGVSSNSGAP